MQLHLKAVNFTALLAMLTGTIKADCTESKSGPGDLTIIKCKSYLAPTKIGEIVHSNSNALAVELTAQSPGGFQYYYVNHMNYDIHFGIQYYNPGANGNAWQIFTIKANSDCFFTIPGHMENFKLTC